MMWKLWQIRVSFNPMKYAILCVQVCIWCRCGFRHRLMKLFAVLCINTRVVINGVKWWGRNLIVLPDLTLHTELICWIILRCLDFHLVNFQAWKLWIWCFNQLMLWNTPSSSTTYRNPLLDKGLPHLMPRPMVLARLHPPDTRPPDI